MLKYVNIYVLHKYVTDLKESIDLHIHSFKTRNLSTIDILLLKYKNIIN